MTADITILIHQNESAIEESLIRLAEFNGIKAEALRLGTAVSDSTLPVLMSGRSRIVVAASTLASLVEDSNIAAEMIKALIEQTPFVLVYGIAGPEHAGCLQWITDGLVSSIESFGSRDLTYKVEKNHPEITGEFSGLEFGPIHNDVDRGFTLSREDSKYTRFIGIDNLSLFGRFKKDRSTVFLVAGQEIADPETRTDGTFRAHQYFSRLVPVMMFFKAVVGNRMWVSPTSSATLIIDDPLIRRSYGFLSYSRLLEEMKDCEFTATVAFIPWNYARTHPGTAALFKKHSNRLFICTHGCDHTSGEFSTIDRSELNRQISLATERMKDHQRRTSLPYDDIMVFPQGRFSSTSLSALKDHSYSAAVNSTAVPTDLGPEHRLTVGDFMRPAISKFGSFPLFIRRYPVEVADFAFDLFLGKPAILVEHHGYFKHGYNRLRDFANRLNALHKSPRWVGLGQLVKQAYLLRKGSGNAYECMVFSNRQNIRNPENVRTQFTISKREDGSTPIRRVCVNGVDHSYVVQDNELKLVVDVPANDNFELSIDYSNTQELSVRPPVSLKRRMKVYVRRRLSEFRDDYVCRYKVLMMLAQLVTKRMSVGGE